MPAHQVKHQLALAEAEGDKETLHAEFTIAGSGLTYQPGDALGLYPINNPPEVERLLQAMHCGGGERMEPVRPSHHLPAACSTLREVLLYCCDLRVVRADLVAAVVASTGSRQQRESGEHLLREGVRLWLLTATLCTV